MTEAYNDELFIDESELQDTYIEDIYTSKGESLKQRFSLNDFLSCYETRNILENAFQEKFEENLEDSLRELYTKICDDHYNQCTGILANARDGTGCSKFVDIVWRHLEKEYDLEIFFQEPELAQPLLETIDDIKQEQALFKRKQLQEKFKKANTTFDWKNKRYV